MKFFDPKKKENTPPPNNQSSTQKPQVMTQPLQPTTVSKPQPQTTPVTPQQPRVESLNPEPLKMEPPKTDPVKTETPKPQPVAAAPTIAMPAPEALKPAPVVTPAPAPVAGKVTGKTLIGNSVVIRGDITSDENLQIEGVVDGSIDATNDVIVGHEGRVNAAISAVNVIIHGRVVGDVTASNRVELAPSALLQGNIRSPRLSIAETAKFKGSVDMRPKETAVKETKEKSNVAAPLEVVEK